jgi:hypothetical protein
MMALIVALRFTAERTRITAPRLTAIDVSPAIFDPDRFLMCTQGELYASGIDVI